MMKPRTGSSGMNQPRLKVSRTVVVRIARVETGMIAWNLNLPGASETVDRLRTDGWRENGSDSTTSRQLFSFSFFFVHPLFCVLCCWTDRWRSVKRWFMIGLIGTPVPERENLLHDGECWLTTNGCLSVLIICGLHNFFVWLWFVYLWHILFWIKASLADATFNSY